MSKENEFATPPDILEGSKEHGFIYSEQDQDEVFGCPLCKETIKRLYEDNRQMLQMIEETERNNNKVKTLYEISAIGLSLRRLPALLVTLVLEMCGGIIINQLHEVIQSLTLIVSFMPAISALSGNLGLQASANTIRGLGTGFIKPKNYKKNIFKEFRSGLISASFVALVMASIGVVWAHFDHSSTTIQERSSIGENSLLNESSSVKQSSLASQAPVYNEITEIPDTNHARKTTFNAFLFGGVIFIGTWVSMMVSTINGAATPILANMLKLDPAKIAGPLETAFQDIVGQSFLLGLSYVAFHQIQHLI